ncbi:hypothetical protein [Pseudoramibacter alactolyticus]|uniref:hypothetical protein n=1 Tax=Pseudoramibacter alactolyticus TaxID=113287 RepID=UPI0028E9B9E5|nr:hypothetical protein [Pseudoramibacter alactolyticus]
MQNQINKSVDVLKQLIIRDGLGQTEQALDLAVSVHAGQFRKNKKGKAIPAVIHPVTVALHAAALGFSEDELLAAALLHDTLEDSTLHELPGSFSLGVREAVDTLIYRGRGKADTSAMPAYYHAVAQNRGTALIKALDRCHNLATMSEGFTASQQKTYIKETKHYVLPMMAGAEKHFEDLKRPFWLVRYQMASVMRTAADDLTGDVLTEMNH